MTVQTVTSLQYQTTTDAYSLLEQKIHKLRLRIMRLAAQIAADQGQSPITITHVEAALKQFIDSGLDVPVSSNRSVAKFPDDAYQFLVRHLITLHTVITGWAANIAQETGSSQKDVVVIAPDHIESAWKILDRPTSRNAVFSSV